MSMKDKIDWAQLARDIHEINQSLAEIAEFFTAVYEEKYGSKQPFGLLDLEGATN